MAIGVLPRAEGAIFLILNVVPAKDSCTEDRGVPVSGLEVGLQNEIFGEAFWVVKFDVEL